METVEKEDKVEFNKKLKKRRIEELKSALFGIWFLFTVFIGFFIQFISLVLLIKYIFTN